MAKIIGLIALIGVVLSSGCSGGSQHGDLNDFMADVRAKPSGEVKPLPTFRSYKTFSYSAMAMRSPFEPPMELAVTNSISGEGKVDPPDENRKKEYLERYNFAALSMVGTLSKSEQIWSLVNDGSGGIHRVATGNYMGKNHGRIISITNSKINVIEVVPDGKGEWVERPRTLALKEKD
ncbi:MAG: pilus assembly protein PilP [Porticoccaceae bacterium]|nr:MAG: pilus assembly protein PilP [Porticoccaceae bacterium]